MFCTKCGKELSTEANFCTACGAAVNGIESETTKKEKVETVRNNKGNGFMIVVFLVIAGSLIFSILGNLEKKIIGDWECQTGGGDWTFYSDGSFQYKAISGTYEVKGNRLTVHVMSALVGNYFETYICEIKGNTMTLTDEDGEEDVYIKQ